MYTAYLFVANTFNIRRLAGATYLPNNMVFIVLSNISCYLEMGTKTGIQNKQHYSYKRLNLW